MGRGTGKGREWGRPAGGVGYVCGGTRMIRGWAQAQARQRAGCRGLGGRVPAMARHRCSGVGGDSSEVKSIRF